ncbi:MAG: hypothetical protein LAP38_26755 [Acidobacteriia bacterium]|nr:hypothetical protein [Terriglobia bacterium]
MSTHSSATPAQASPDNIEQLRILHGVRPLQPEEEGSATARLPAGVYGYSYAPGQPETPVFAKKDYHSFEVHKAADGTEYAIGFVTPEEASQLAAAKEGAAIQLFPDPWEGSRFLVSVRVSGIAATKRMPREAGNPFPFTIA